MAEYRFGVEIEILVAPKEALELCAVQYGYDPSTSKGRQQRVNRIALQQALGQIFHDSNTDIKMEYFDEGNGNENEYVEWAVTNDSSIRDMESPTGKVYC